MVERGLVLLVVELTQHRMGWWRAWNFRVCETFLCVATWCCATSTVTVNGDDGVAVMKPHR